MNTFVLLEAQVAYYGLPDSGGVGVKQITFQIHLYVRGKLYIPLKLFVG